MTNWRLVIAVVTLVVVLAISWGLYFVVTSVFGYDLGLTVDYLVVTAAVVLTFVGLELLVRNRRSKSRKDIHV